MDSENLLHFQVQLKRHYPHVYDMAKLLSEDYSLALENIKEKQGYLEVEATFGKISYDAKGAERFNHAIPIDVMREIVNILGAFSGWSSISDWFLVYDYDIGSRKRVRVSYENQAQQISCIQKKLLFRRDVGYREADDGSHEWKLRDFITRINTKFEEKCEYPQDALLAFLGVRVSLRKYFIIPSNNLPGISWRMEVIQTWSGTSLAAVEENMVTQPPICSFECEIINLPQMNTLNSIEKMLLFSSLMLKMQDLLDIPACATEVVQTGTLTPTAIPTFRLI